MREVDLIGSEPLEQPIGRLTAEVAAAQRCPQSLDHLGGGRVDRFSDPCQERRRLLRCRAAAVPLVVQDPRNRLEVTVVHAEHPRRRHELAGSILTDEKVEGGSPTGAPGDARPNLVEHHEPGRQAGLERVLGQESLAEPVDRADRCFVDLRQRDRGRRAVAVLAGRGRQRAPDPRPELRRGRLGEGDCGDLAQFRTPAPDELDDALDHCRRLARAGARLHEERRIEIFRDRTARLFVRQGPRSGGRRRLEL